jgi:hypothetical protein
VWNAEAGKHVTKADVHPTWVNKGALRLVRVGSDLSYYVSDGVDKSFTLLATYPFGDEDVHEIQIIGSTGGEKAFVDARLTDLRVRADSIPNAPLTANESAARNFKILISAALLIGLAVVVVIVLGLVLFLRSRRGAKKALKSGSKKGSQS